MYQVIMTYSENEPWWFFDEWQEDITKELSFDTFEAACNYFKDICHEYSDKFESHRVKDDYLVAFWNENDLIYCEDCDEELQAYYGVMLVKNYKKLDDGDSESDEAINYSGKAKCCQRHS
ncbi:DUF1033 family protein [Vagococcus penaei]|uniref:Uncharacterized protein n=1 Tax=Vagococcus penaei TaxID=633807 RepID=A0A1Q2D8I4_9ENTE|nr:DUF1033 family protein [Vagococcus penaei]AQP54694.1 hypothetical protein BW732_11055 [Vagococcus penaei]